MLYLDASAFVAAFAPEPMSARVIACLGRFPEHSIVSTWTQTEAFSALCLKVRTGVLNVSQAGVVQAAMIKSLATEFESLAVDNGDIVEAGKLLLLEGPPLRAGDALHLALARRSGAQLLTLDQGLARAAVYFSTPVADI
jgi:predicted nucleic acid-binding protein